MPKKAKNSEIEHLFLRSRAIKKGNYSAPPQNIGYAVKLAINSWQV